MAFPRNTLQHQKRAQPQIIGLRSGFHQIVRAFQHPGTEFIHVTFVGDITFGRERLLKQPVRFLSLIIHGNNGN